MKLLADNASPEHEKLFVRELSVLSATKSAYVALVFGVNIHSKPWFVVQVRAKTTACLLEVLTKPRLKLDWKVRFHARGQRRAQAARRRYWWRSGSARLCRRCMHGCPPCAMAA